MKIKKLLTGVLAAAAACAACTAVCAQPQLSAQVAADGTATVSVVTDSAGQQTYMLYILEPGCSEENFNDTAAQELIGMYKIEQLIHGQQVNDTYTAYEYVFSVKDTDAPGLYTVIAAGADFDAALDSRRAFFVVASDAEAAALSAANSAAAGTAESVLTAYQDTVWRVNFDNAAYRTHKNAVLENFAAMAGGFACGGDVQAAFETACILTELRYAERDAVYPLLNEYEYALDVEYCADIRSEDADFLNAFLYLRSDLAVTPLRTAEELSVFLRHAEALAAVNRSERTGVVDAIRTYNDVFGIDFSGDLHGISDYDLAKEIVVTGGNDYQSIAAVVSAVETAAETLQDSGSGGSSGSGGRDSGGGGGGYFGGQTTASGVPITSGVTPEMMNTISPSDDAQWFTDLAASSWAEPYIDYLSFNGIMVGDGDGRFRPEADITREEFIKVLVSALRLDEAEDTDAAEAAPSFSDVAEDAWYVSYISVAAQLGITTGIDANTFGIGESITRQDAATLIVRAKDYLRQEFAGIGDTPAEFTDGDSIADYAAEAVQELQKAEIINGYEDGAFRPENPITRAETAKVIYCMLEKLSML